MRDIGKNIRSLREQRKLTQEELAQRLFVTRQTVSNYETGRSRPDLDMLVKIAQVLEADVNQVLYGAPVAQDRQRDAKRLGIGCLVLAAAVLLVTLPAPLMNEILMRGYLMRDYTGAMLWSVLNCLLKPTLWLTLGWCALQGLGVCRVIKPLEDRAWVRWVRRGVLLLLALYAALILPLLVVGILQLVQTWAGLPGQALVEALQIPAYTWLLNRLLWFNVLYTPAYAVVGGVLWLFRFPK